MKVLWLTNHIMPDHAQALGLVPSPRGGWLSALAAAIQESRQLTLGVATNIHGKPWQQDVINGVRYYTVPCCKFPICNGRLSIASVNAYQRVVEDFMPDVIHIHGTEYFQGLLSGHGHINRPTVISIQGILDVCQKHYFGGMSVAKLITTRTLRDYIRFDGIIEQRVRLIKRAREEREIFKSNLAFIGRTTWDKAHIRRLNPRARYYHCDELIRHPFYTRQWDIKKIHRYSIFASGAYYPLKGFHVLLKALALLKDEFPDSTVRTPLVQFYPDAKGVKRFWLNCRKTGYARYLTDLICKKKLGGKIFQLPLLDADAMAAEMQKAHVFVLPSLIENSPNSLAEAMLVGTPSVASFVGGVPSMVQDGYSALLFPSGDEAVLAEQIRRIFLDNGLAKDLSVRAQEVALRRHLKENIVDNMLGIYRREQIIARIL